MGMCLGGHGVAVHDLDVLQGFDHRFLLGIMLSPALLNTRCSLNLSGNGLTREDSAELPPGR